MIIYKDLKHSAATKDYINIINSLIDRIIYSQSNSHSLAVELLIDYSDLESALTDLYSDKEEKLSPLITDLRLTGKMIGYILLRSWESETDIIEKINLGKLKNSINKISSYELPESITVKVPEGYAYYGYYPETYIDAAKKFYNAVYPKEAVVIGIRSIGTSFSSVVTAFLESKGCSVDSYTVRPKGDYNSRFLNLSRELTSELCPAEKRCFLIVDEGPGLSGSSFGITAERLSCLGIPDQNIYFISSWVPDGSGLISDIGRKRWKMHKKFSSSFEDTWIKTGRLTRDFPYGELMDISNGAWRSLFYLNAEESPAIYPAEESKKFLCSKYPFKSGNGILRKSRKFSINKKNENVYLVKFIGLGRYGKALFERAKILSNSFYIPHVAGFENGFIIFEFVKGSPLKKEDISPEILNNTAEYMNFLCNRFPSSPSRSLGEMFEMITENVGEYLGAEWIQRLEKGKNKLTHQYSRFAVALDGHMFPHEWILSKTGSYKTDAITHHADQFFPGCQSILWDIVGFSVESQLDRRKEQFLINRFSEISAQRQISEYLGFYKIAYLAFRLGYSAVVSNVLSSSMDGQKAKKQTDWYAGLIKREIVEQCS